MYSQRFDAIMEILYGVSNCFEVRAMGRNQDAIDRRNSAAQKLAKDYGDTLWHYTNIRALDGILSKKEIW